MTANELGLLLHEYGVYDSLQFISGAQSAISSAQFCKDVINSLHSGVKTATDKWNEAISEMVLENKKANNTKAVPFDWPDYMVTIAGVKIRTFTAQDIFIGTFFQSCRNAFDILSQAANVGCLASKAKKTKDVGFRKMEQVFHEQAYNQAFPEMSMWFENVKNSEEFKYIDAYCNITKHTCYMPTQFTLPLFGCDNKATLPPFYREREAIQFDKKDVMKHIPMIFEFVLKSNRSFVDALKKEITKRTYTGNRFNTVTVYQQKFLQNADDGFSFAFIDAPAEFPSMPETIQVLFAHKLKYSDGKEEMEAANCLFDTIYVKEKDAKDINGLVGKYVAESPMGEDNLLRFRTYKKVVSDKNSIPLIFQAMEDEKQRGRFYRQNSYFSVMTISDDPEFIKLVGTAS